MPVGFRRPGSHFLVPVLLMLFAAASATAQDAPVKMGGKAFRTSLGATLLLPMTADVMEMDAERLPSGRALLEIQANPVFGFHLGGLRLAPNMLWAEDGAGFGADDPQSRLALTAGVLGFRLNFTTGRFRIGPFVDGGFGQVQGMVDRGGYSYVPTGAEDDGYAPVFEKKTSLMAGGGGGLVTDLILGPGLTLNALGGYWHFIDVAPEDEYSSHLDAEQLLAMTHLSEPACLRALDSLLGDGRVSRAEQAGGREDRLIMIHHQQLFRPGAEAVRIVLGFQIRRRVDRVTLCGCENETRVRHPVVNPAAVRALEVTFRRA